MGKCLEPPLFSAWVNKGWGSRSVQRVLLQIGTLIIHNQTYQVSSAVKAAGSEKADQESEGARILTPWSSSLSFLFDHGGLFCFRLTEKEWEANTLESHPVQPITGASEGSLRFWNSASKIGAFSQCRLVPCVSVATLLRDPGDASSLRALLTSHLLIHSHIWIRLWAKVLLEASVWLWKQLFVHHLKYIFNMLKFHLNSALCRLLCLRKPHEHAIVIVRWEDVFSGLCLCRYWIISTTQG